MPRNAVSGRFPFKTELIKGMFFDGTNGTGTVAAPADVKIATKTVRVIMRVGQLYSVTRGVFGLNTANWYFAAAGGAYRYSYFNAAGVQDIGNSSNVLVANRPQEVVLTHSNDGIPGGEVYIDWYLDGAFVNRVTKAGGDGGGAWGTTLSIGGAITTKHNHTLYLAEIYNTALTAQDVYDLRIGKAIGTNPLHRYVPDASASTITDTGTGTALDMVTSSAWLVADAPFKDRSAATNRTAATNRVAIT